MAKQMVDLKAAMMVDPMAAMMALPLVAASVVLMGTCWVAWMVLK